MCRFVSRFQNATSLEDLMRVMMKASLSGEELFMKVQNDLPNDHD